MAAGRPSTGRSWAVRTSSSGTASTTCTTSRASWHGWPTSCARRRGMPPRPPLVERFADPLALVELFAVGNIAFLAVDIGIAHAINAFGHQAEWVPVAFSLAATPVLLAAMAIGGIRPTLAGSEEPG